MRVYLKSGNGLEAVEVLRVRDGGCGLDLEFADGSSLMNWRFCVYDESGREIEPEQIAGNWKSIEERVEALEEQATNGNDV